MKEKILQEIKNLELNEAPIHDIQTFTKVLESKIYYSDTEKGDPGFSPDGNTNAGALNKRSLKRFIKRVGKAVLRRIYNPLKKITKYLLTALDPELLNSFRMIPTLSSEISSLRGKLNDLETQHQSLSKTVAEYLYPKIPFDQAKLESKSTTSRREKHSKYLPYLNSKGRILEIECGKGKFLQLLAKNDFKNVMGIDRDSDMVIACKTKKLNVEESDAITFLREAKNNNMRFSAIVCQNVVESLYPKHFFDFIRLSYACLEKEGKLIIETPNTEMLATISKDFYRNLTSFRPYPLNLINMILKDLGFKDIEVLYINDTSETEKLSLDNIESAATRENFDKLNQLLFSHQDVILIANK